MSDEEYGGLVGAYPYAFRTSGSLLFRSYVVVGGLVAAFASLIFLTALPLWVAATVGGPVTTTLSRAFLVLVALALVAPLVAPVLLVARHHRLSGFDHSTGASGTSEGDAPEDGRQPDKRYDAALAASGYLFALSLYLGLLAAVPAGSREPPPAAVAPLVEFLYGLPPVGGVGPPLVAVLVMALVHRRLR